MRIYFSDDGSGNQYGNIISIISRTTEAPQLVIQFCGDSLVILVVFGFKS